MRMLVQFGDVVVVFCSLDRLVVVEASWPV
jgi:hypothetical protein